MAGKVLVARRQAGPRQKALMFLVVGFAIGLSAGYLVMGTARAIIQTSIDQQLKELGKSSAETKPGRDNKGSGSGGSTVADIDKVHIVTTTNGSPYQNYQMRIAYATFKLTQSMPGGERFVAFTRILHRTEPDELMDEIPTFRADPLQPECDKWCAYPVSDRANAMKQFLDASEKNKTLIQASWVYMVESDYVFMKPLELPPPGSKPMGAKVWAFPYDYIAPHAVPEEMKKLWPGGEPAMIPNTGPAPILTTLENWKLFTPDWQRLAGEIEADEGMKKQLGWVREMYGFSIALAKNAFYVDLTPPGQSKLIAQLPGEDSLGQAHAFHYTQCTIYKTIDGDKDVWGYDKRFHTSEEDALKVPLIPVPPKFEEGKWKFVEGNPVTRSKHEAIVQMIEQMNRGIKTLKDLSKRRRKDP